jgi:hypothetical protein
LVIINKKAIAQFAAEPGHDGFNGTAFGGIGLLPDDFVNILGSQRLSFIFDQQ